MIVDVCMCGSLCVRSFDPVGVNPDQRGLPVQLVSIMFSVKDSRILCEFHVYVR